MPTKITTQEEQQFIIAAKNKLRDTTWQTKTLVKQNEKAITVSWGNFLSLFLPQKYNTSKHLLFLLYMIENIPEGKQHQLIIINDTLDRVCQKEPLTQSEKKQLKRLYPLTSTELFIEVMAQRITNNHDISSFNFYHPLTLQDRLFANTHRENQDWFEHTIQPLNGKHKTLAQLKSQLSTIFTPVIKAGTLNFCFKANAIKKQATTIITTIITLFEYQRRLPHHEDTIKLFYISMVYLFPKSIRSKLSKVTQQGIVTLTQQAKQQLIITTSRKSHSFTRPLGLPETSNLVENSSMDITNRTLSKQRKNNHTATIRTPQTSIKKKSCCNKITDFFDQTVSTLHGCFYQIQPVTTTAENTIEKRPLA